MPNMPNLNIVKVNPNLQDRLDLLRTDILLDLNCHAIATVQEFNAVNQTITATMNYTKTIYQEVTDPNDINNVLFQPTYIDYPILMDVPAIIISGGNASLTMPIQQGDQCLVLFNDRELDSWFSGGGQKTNLGFYRLHSFADAMAIVGLFPTGKSIPNYDPVRALLTNGSATVGINPVTNKIILQNGSQTLLDIFVDFVNNPAGLIFYIQDPNTNRFAFQAYLTGEFIPNLQALLEDL